MADTTRERACGHCIRTRRNCSIPGSWSSGTASDLGAEHILELDGALTGIIDWSDAAVTDPALDFARLYRDFGPAFLAQVLEAYGPLPEAMPRIEFFARCAALEDLAFGEATGRHEYAAGARRSFSWLFPQRG